VLLLPLATTTAVDVGAYSLLYAGVILQATVGNAALPEQNSAAHIINSMAAVLLWFNLLYYLRPYQSTGPLVMMIFEIIADMRTFLVILAIVVVGFGNGEHAHYAILYTHYAAHCSKCMHAISMSS
jgi:hypothetical protein